MNLNSSTVLKIKKIINGIFIEERDHCWVKLILEEKVVIKNL